MQYSSPFHLLPERDISALTTAELKRWKKELLLQFDLQKSTTISINEKEYDKNDVLQAFDLLKDSPEYHLRLYQNKPLLEFLEEGYIDFFDDEGSWADFWDTTYCDWLAQWFIPAYDEMMYALVENKGFESIATLQTLYKSKFNLPQEWNDIAHQKTYRHLNNFVEQANGTLEAMQLTESPKIKLNAYVQEYVDAYYANVLDLLPQNFDGIRREYGNFAHNVIASIFDVERRLRDVERSSLITVREAAKIDIRFRDDEYSKGLLELIENYLGSPTESANEASNHWKWVLFAVLIFSFRVCANLNTSSTPDFVNMPSTTTIIKQPKDLKKSDIFGTWTVKHPTISFATTHKTLTFNNESSGTVNATVITNTQDTCTIHGDFTWTLVLGDIDIYYKNIDVVKDFTRYSNSGEKLRDKVLNNFSESLTPDAMTVASSTMILSLTGINGTYRRTNRIEKQ